MPVDLSQIITAEDKAAAEQARRRAGVNAKRDRRLAAGAMISLAGYGDIPLQGRAGDQINLIALGDTAHDLIAAGVTAAVIRFRNAQIVMHTLTPAQLLEAARRGKEIAAAIYATSWAMKDGGDIPEDYAADTNWPCLFERCSGSGARSANTGAYPKNVCCGFECKTLQIRLFRYNNDAALCTDFAFDTGPFRLGKTKSLFGKGETWPPAPCPPTHMTPNPSPRPPARR